MLKKEVVNYTINSLDEYNRTLRLNPNKREEIRSTFLNQCLSDADFLQKISPYFNHLKRLLATFPDHSEALLSAVLKKTDFIHRNLLFSFNYNWDDNDKLEKMLKTFPAYQHLIMTYVLSSEAWINYAIKSDSDLSIWYLKKLAMIYPDHAKTLWETVQKSENIWTYLIPEFKILHDNFSFDCCFKEFIDEFRKRDVGLFLNNITINDEDKLLEMIRLFPRHAKKLLDQAVTNEDFLHSIKIGYHRIDVLKQILAYFDKNSNTEIFEKLFNKPGVLFDILVEHKESSFFRSRNFNSLKKLFPHSKARMFELIFNDSNPKLNMVMSDLIMMIKEYPHARQFFYEQYLQQDKDFNGYIINTVELVDLMKLYPAQALTFLEKAFKNPTFISWRGFRTGYTAGEPHDQNYIAKILHSNPTLAEDIFTTVFGSDELMSNLISKITPKDMLGDLALLVKYFPNHSVEIFQYAFPNPKTLEKRLVCYEEYAPKLAEIFPNIYGIKEGRVFNNDNELTIIEVKSNPAKFAKEFAKSAGNSMFAFFDRLSHKFGDKVEETMKDIDDDIYINNQRSRLGS